MLGGHSDGSKAYTPTAEDDRGNRPRTRHVEVGGDEVEMLNLVVLEDWQQRREVGNGIGSAIVEMEAIGRDAGGGEDSMSAFRLFTRGDPDIEIGIIASEQRGSFFPFWSTA